MSQSFSGHTSTAMGSWLPHPHHFIVAHSCFLSAGSVLTLLSVLVSGQEWPTDWSAGMQPHFVHAQSHSYLNPGSSGRCEPPKARGCFLNWEHLVELQVSSTNLWLQGYTLADEEEDPLIYQHRMLRSGQGDALASGPVETGPMKKLHVSTINLQKAGPLFLGRLGKESPTLLCCSKLLALVNFCLREPKTSPRIFLKI